MKPSNKRLFLTALLTAILIASLSTFITYTLVNPQADLPSDPYVIEPPTVTETASYVVWRNGSYYYAKNGSSGAVVTTANFSTMVPNLIANNTNIFLKNGVYPTSVRFNFSDCQNITLCGEGWGTVIKATTMLSEIISIGGYATDYSESITIKDLVIDGDEIESMSRGIYVGWAYNILIDHVWVKGCSRYELCIYGNPQGDNYTAYLPRFVTVQNCLFQGYTGKSNELVLIGGIDNTFKDNEIDCNGATSVVALQVYDNSYHKSRSNIISGNYIHCDTYCTMQAVNILICDTRFENNRIEGFETGILVQPTGEQLPYEGEMLQLYDNQLIGNIITRCGTGIQVHNTGQVIIANNKVFSNNYTGISIVSSKTIAYPPTFNTSNILICNNEVYNNGQSATFQIGIYLQDANTSDTTSVMDTIIAGNLIFDNQTSPTQIKGICFTGNSTRISITSNVISVDYPFFFTAESYLLDSSVFGNIGFVTENSGTSEIAASTSVVVTHGLAGTPDVVTVTIGTTGAGDYYVDTLTATQFTVHVANSGTYTVYWSAEYKP